MRAVLQSPVLMTQNSVKFNGLLEIGTKLLKHHEKHPWQMQLTFGTDGKKINYVKGANISAFKKVADTILLMS